LVVLQSSVNRGLEMLKHQFLDNLLLLPTAQMLAVVSADSLFNSLKIGVDCALALAALFR